jgi:hypothetical protein
MYKYHTIGVNSGVVQSTENNVAILNKKEAAIANA